MSLRLKLTVWYVSLLAVILIAFGVGLFTTTWYSLNQQIDQDLTSRASEVQAALGAALAAQASLRSLMQQGGVIIPSADAFASGSDLFVQISTLDGTTITKSNNLGTQRLVLDPTALERVNRGETTTYEFQTGTARLRALVTPLVDNRNRPIGVIQVAESLRQVDLALTRLATEITLVIVLGLVLASVGGAFLARSALRPIDRITATARQITRANDLSRRLEPTGLRREDEVGRLVQTFNEMLERIEELFRAQQRFVADVSHELRSPLTVIRGNLDLIRRGAVNDSVGQNDVLAAVDSEVNRMNRLVADLLLLARADAGLPTRREPVELDTLLLDVYRHAQVIANGVHISLGAEDQATVLGDADRLKQLLVNLVDNAIKYTPPGGQVRLSLARSEGQVQVAVRDTGIGIAPEDIPHLFDRFYRVDKSRSRGAGGTGLGLAIAKYVADAHGGTIQVESEVGKGSTFTLSLPLAPETISHTASPDAATTSEVGSTRVVVPAAHAVSGESRVSFP